LKPEEHRIFSASLDDTIRCWDPYDNCCLRTYKNDRSAEVACMLYSKMHQLIISGHEDGGVRLWNPDSGTCLKLRPSETDQKTENHQNMIACMTLGRLQKGGERCLLTADYDGRIGVFDLRKGRDAKPHLKCIHQAHGVETGADAASVDLFAPAPHEILCMALGPRREWKKAHNVAEPETELLYTAGNDLVIRVWDERRVANREKSWPQEKFDGAHRKYTRNPPVACDV
jgi:WD40 repeat protein